MPLSQAIMVFGCRMKSFRSSSLMPWKTPLPPPFIWISRTISIWSSSESEPRFALAASAMLTPILSLVNKNAISGEIAFLFTRLRIGVNIAEAAKAKRGSDSLDDQIEMVLEIQMNGGGSGVFHGMSEDDLKLFMRHS